MEKRLSDRLSAPWHPLDALWVGLVVLAIMVIATSVLFALVEQRIAFVLAGLALEMALVGVTLLWVGLRHPDGIAALRLGAPRPGRVVVWGFVGGLALYALTVFVVAPILYALVSLITGEPIEAPRQEILPQNPEAMHVLLAGFVAVIAAPIGEEIFFRGLLHTGLRSRMPFWWAAVISSAVFAIFHVIPLLMPLFFAVGMGLAYLYERRGTLLAPIAAHVAFNIVGFLFLVFGPA